MKKALIFLLIAGIVAFAILGYNGFNSTERRLDKSVGDMMDNLKAQMQKDPRLAASSNPYDYIKSNAGYESIVKMGYKALPVILDKVEKSPQNGLQEYILAAAGEEIAGVDLKGDSFNWSTGKEWAREWRKHLRNLPQNIDTILSAGDTTEAKNSKLIKLGAPAIPFLMDRIEAGQTELTPALEALLQGNTSASLDAEGKKDIKASIKANKSKFEILRDMVNDAQTT